MLKRTLLLTLPAFQSPEPLTILDMPLRNADPSLSTLGLHLNSIVTT